MPFVVLPALPADISDVYNIYFAAFKDNIITKALFPFASAEDMTNPESEFRYAIQDALIRQFLQYIDLQPRSKGHTAHSLKWLTDEAKSQYTLKCVDTETNKIVGMALWDIYLTPSDWKKGEIGWLQGEQRESAEALIMPLWDARAKYWLNERYVYCHVMAVHPDYQKKGIGKLMMDFGIQFAKQAGLPIYLESSKEGLKLYENVGFKHLKDRPTVKGESGEDEEVLLLAWAPEGREDVLPKGVQFK